MSCDDEDTNDRLSDEYHEDSLPDLVLTGASNSQFENAGSSSRLTSSSVDLLTQNGDLIESNINNNNSKTKSSSISDLHTWNEEEYNSTNQEVITEVSSRGVLKVSFVDHSKTYVPRVSHNDRYRSYLSLMPEDNPEPIEEEDEAKKAQILSDFRVLSFEEQQRLRCEWIKDLEILENDIIELKEKLAFKTAWCGVLRRNLGMSGWRRLSNSCAEHMAQITEITSDSFHRALEATETKLLSSQSLQKAKESFESLASEVKERMKQGREDFVRKMSHLSIPESQNETKCDVD